MNGQTFRRIGLFSATAFMTAVFAFGPVDLSAQGGTGLGESLIVPRLGVTLGPEQISLGVEFVFTGIADITHFEFRPGADLGFGDDKTTLRGSANVGYSVPTSGGDVRVTPLVGISAYYESYDFDPGDGQPRRSESDTDLGVNIGAAAQAGDLIFEAVVIVGGEPDISISVGFGIG